MKRLLAAAGISAVLATAGCGQPDNPEDASVGGGSSAPASTGGAIPEPAGPETASTPRPAEGATAAPAARGAPDFAVIYPGGVAKEGALSAQGPAGPGGRIEFTTSASPDEVVAFYRHRAEAAGLRSINTLNRDEVRGYAAGDGATGRGKLLNVVATPLEDGTTDVLLMWSTGA